MVGSSEGVVLMLMKVDLVVEVKYSDNPAECLRKALKSMEGYITNDKGSDSGEVWVKGVSWISMIERKDL